MRLYLLTKDNDLNPAGTDSTNQTFAAFFMRALTTKSWSKAEVSHWMHHSLHKCGDYVLDEFECDGEDLLFMYHERENMKSTEKNKFTELFYDGMFKEDVSWTDLIDFWEEVGQLVSYDKHHKATMVCNGLLGILSDMTHEDCAAAKSQAEEAISGLHPKYEIWYYAFVEMII